MKKTLLFVLALAPALAFAQAPSRLTLGVKGGIGSAFATGPGQPPKNDFYTNYNAGLFLTMSSSEHFAVTIEAMFAQKGYKGHEESDGITVTGTARQRYIDVPILFRYFVNDRSSSVRPNIFAGPSFNALLSSQYTLEGNGESYDFDGKNVTPGFELSGVVGIGVNIRTAENQWLYIDARYNQGITQATQKGDITVAGMTGSLEPDKYYNSSGIISIGYGFGL